MEEEYRTSPSSHRKINKIDIIIPSENPTIICKYVSGIHDFDKAMENVSIGLSQNFMVEILIRNARVRRTRIGYAT